MTLAIDSMAITVGGERSEWFFQVFHPLVCLASIQCYNHVVAFVLFPCLSELLKLNFVSTFFALAMCLSCSTFHMSWMFVCLFSVPFLEGY